MTQRLQAPRNLSPMWLDLAHVIAAEPTRVMPQALRDTHRHRCAMAMAEWSASEPAPRWRLSWPALLLAQAGGAALTAGLLMLMGLGPV